MAYAPIAKLDKFTGEEDDAQVWLNDVAKAITANNWDDARAILSASSSNLLTTVPTQLSATVSGKLSAPTTSNTTTEFISKQNSKAEINTAKLEIVNEGIPFNNPKTNQKQSLTNNIPPATVTNDKSLAAIFPFKLEETTPVPLFSGAALDTKPITTMYTDAKVDGYSIKLILDSESAGSIITKQLMDQLGYQVNCAASTRIITANGTTKTLIGEIDDFSIKVNGIIVPIKELVMEAIQYQALVGNDWLSKTNALLDWNMQKLQISQNGQHTCVLTMCGWYTTTNLIAPLIEFKKEKKNLPGKLIKCPGLVKNTTSCHQYLCGMTITRKKRKEKNLSGMLTKTEKPTMIRTNYQQLGNGKRIKEKKKRKRKKKIPYQPLFTLHIRIQHHNQAIIAQNSYASIVARNCYQWNALNIQNKKKNETMNHAWLVEKLFWIKEYRMTFLDEEEHMTNHTPSGDKLSNVWTNVHMMMTKSGVTPEEIKTIKDNPLEPIELDWDSKPVINLLDPEQFHKHYQELAPTREEQEQQLEEINIRLCDYCLIPCDFQYCNKYDLIYNLPPCMIYTIPKEEEPISSCASESESIPNPDSDSNNDDNKNNSSSSIQNGNNNDNDSNSDSNSDSNYKQYITLPDLTKEQELKWFSNNNESIMSECMHDTNTGSSLAKKRINIRGGIIDAEYVRNIIAMLQNDSEKAYTIDPNKKIAQVIFLSLVKIAQLVLVKNREELGITARGIQGFGSTSRINIPVNMTEEEIVDKEEIISTCQAISIPPYNQYMLAIKKEVKDQVQLFEAEATICESGEIGLTNLYISANSPKNIKILIHNTTGNIIEIPKRTIIEYLTTEVENQPPNHIPDFSQLCEYVNIILQTIYG
ncbi:hypothetical protein G9A89_007077 [Geosiphon pyriformis]|nr:hypothetical protein G9A89_007077 [Geosiphon pyriformis]